MASGPASNGESVYESAHETKSDITTPMSRPITAASASASAAAAEKSCRTVPSSVSSEKVELPETAPILYPNLLPTGFQIPRPLWETVYSILRDHQLKAAFGQGDQDEWMNIQQFQIDFARRSKKALSKEYLHKTTGARSYKQFFIDNPWTDYKITKNDVMYVKLTHPSLCSKAASVLCDMKPHYIRPPKKIISESSKLNENNNQCSTTNLNAGGNNPEAINGGGGDNESELMIPNQPRDLIPRDVNIPQSLRERIYRLLWFHFRDGGVNICTFSEAYIKRYGTPLAPANDCYGVPTVDYLFRCIADIVDAYTGPGNILWLKPIDYDVIKQKNPIKVVAKKPIDRIVVVEKKEEKPIRPPAASDLDKFLSPISLSIAIADGQIQRSVSGPAASGPADQMKPEPAAAVGSITGGQGLGNGNNTSRPQSQVNTAALKLMLCRHVAQNSVLQRETERKAVEHYQALEAAKKKKAQEKLYETIHQIVSITKIGIRLQKLPDIYEALTENQLALDEVGFDGDLDEFIRCRPDLFLRRCAPDGNDILVLVNPTTK